MAIRFFSLLLAAILSFFSVILNAQGFGVLVDSAQQQTGQVVCVPVRAHGFDEIVSFQYSLSWDQQILTFDRTQNYDLPGWIPSNFNSNAPGRLLVSWTDPNGNPQSRANDAILYEVCFDVIGPLGSSTYITPGGEGFPPTSGGAEAYNNNSVDVWDLSLCVPGFVEVTATSGTSELDFLKSPPFQLTPNPTLAGTQVSVQSPVAAAATLSVADVSGKLVFEQQVLLKTGENVLEIPAQALKAKGAYQVSLKTEQGVASQMLSVQ